MERFNFWDVFQQTSSGGLTPKRTIRVNGVTFGPGVIFGSGVSFGGIDFTQHLGREIAGEKIGEIIEIRGIYS